MNGGFGSTIEIRMEKAVVARWVCATVRIIDRAGRSMIAVFADSGARGRGDEALSRAAR